MRLLGIGDNVCDVYVHTGIMYPGGQTVNVAAGAKLLGADAEYLGVIGSDEIAAHVKATLTEMGIPYTRSRLCDGEGGYARVKLVDGDRVFIGSNRGGVRSTHPMKLDADDVEYISGFTVAHTSNNAYLDDQLPVMARSSAIISYDFSTQWDEEDRIARVAPYADAAFLSCGDVSEAEAESISARLADMGFALVCATLGSAGAMARAGGRVFRQAAKLVKAVDTLGAGDAFTAGVLVSVGSAVERGGRCMWDDGGRLASLMPAALEAGAEYAARACLTMGAFGHGVPVPENFREKLLGEE